MGSARTIVKRRKAVRNIHKITQTMQLIATARFQKCLQRASASKPYTENITEMISVLAGMESAEHPLLVPNAGAKRSILLTITSNRGLCGSYNAAVLRVANEQRGKLADAGTPAELEMVGKKGIAYMKFLRAELSQTVTDVEDKIAFSRVADMAERYMKLYEAGEIASVDIAYMSFVSVGVQKPAIARLLPIEPPETDDEQAPTSRPDFEFSPPPAELLGRLIPQTVKIRLYQLFNEAIVSEQVGRMIAMKAATDAASDMIKFLSREYNRARQSAITTELADIVGGASAVE